MCGTPNASRETVDFPEIGALISPEVSGNGRQANQYAAVKRAISKTAMLRLIARRSGVEKNTPDCNGNIHVASADSIGCHRRVERIFRSGGSVAGLGAAL